MPPLGPHNVLDVPPLISAIELSVVCPGFSPPTRLCCPRAEGIHPSVPRALPVLSSTAASERSEVSITWRYQGA